MYQSPYFIKKFISTNRSRVKDPHFLAKKQQKMAIFDKTYFWGLTYPLEVRIQHKTCSTICGKPVPEILNHKNSTESTGQGQNMAHLGAFLGHILTFPGPSCRAGRIVMVQNG